MYKFFLKISPESSLLNEDEEKMKLVLINLLLRCCNLKKKVERYFVAFLPSLNYNVAGKTWQFLYFHDSTT